MTDQPPLPDNFCPVILKKRPVMTDDRPLFQALYVRTSVRLSQKFLISNDIFGFFGPSHPDNFCPVILKKRPVMTDERPLFQAL